MNSDDRMDEALRAIARAEASRDFATQVRTRLEAGEAASAAWPRVAIACAAVLLVATLAWWVREVQPERSEQVARATPRTVVSLPEQPVSQLEQRLAPTAWSRSGRGSPPSNLVAPVPTATGDHDRALAPLSPINAMSVSSIAPDAMVVVDHVISPLAQIAPLSDVHDTVEDVDPGEL